MSLKFDIQESTVLALKNHDVVSLSVLRLLNSEIKNSEIDKKFDNLPDDEVISLIQKQVKQRKEAIELYKKGNRLDLADNEEKELLVLNKYLPPQLTEEEVRKVIDNVVADLGTGKPSDFGVVMKKVMGMVKGQSEGNLVAGLVKQKLG